MSAAAAAVSHPTAPPTPATTAVVDPANPAAPADCRTATALPVNTPPPLAVAADAIMLAATEFAAMPAAVNPAADRANGAKNAAPP